MPNESATIVQRYEPEKYRRRSIRLNNYDYSQAGVYFVTICTYNRECLFGEIANSQMELSPIGAIAYQCWCEIPKHFNPVQLDEFIVMPNHIHGIIVITENRRGEVTSPSGMDGVTNEGTGTVPLRKPMGGTGTVPLRKPTLGQIVAYYKYQTTKMINRLGNTPGNPVWQRNYYEHVVRNEDDLGKIREYIVNNPLKWEWDEENPENIKQRGLLQHAQ
ncbi:MAG: transposase [Chloroflexi bacterium]|nr:transposase [Chloroflexota bacterium]MCL5076296.1 transposase [Chloroflexota bacterium]